MINIVNQQEKALTINELAIGNWYRLPSGNIVNLYQVNYGNSLPVSFLLTGFSKDDKSPVIVTYGPSCNLKFYPIEVERVDIVIK